MNIVNLISKKRDGGEHSSDEIGALVHGYVRGDVPDYQRQPGPWPFICAA
jgi:thymidine phosphorylase